MKIKNAVIALLGVSLSFAAQANNNVCLSGVCLGDPISHLPKNIPWKVTVLPDSSKSQFALPSWKTKLEKTVKADPAVLKELVPFSHPFGEVRQLNGKTIAALGKIRGVCEQLNLDGEFLSESGHPTYVKARVFPNEDGSSQVIRIVQLTRFYKNVKTPEEINSLAEQVQEQFKIPVQASFMTPVNGRFNRYANGTPDDLPQASMSYESFVGATVLKVHLPRTMNEDPMYTYQLIRKLPECVTTQKID